MTERRRHHRRKTDRWPHGPTRGASIWLTIVSFLVLIALIGARNSQDRADRAVRGNAQALSAIQAGRKNALNVTCTLATALLIAGKRTIASAAVGRETVFTRNLERIGYPPPSVRRAEATATARAYTATILEVMAKNPTTRDLGIIRPNGTLNCKRFQQIGHAR